MVAGALVSVCSLSSDKGARSYSSEPVGVKGVQTNVTVLSSDRVSLSLRVSGDAIKKTNLVSSA